MIERSAVYLNIVPLLADLVPDWGFEGWDEAISEDTRLIDDLNLTSVDFIDLFVAIEKAFGRTFGFHDLLMVDGRYIADLTLGQLTDFLVSRINSDVREAPQRSPGANRSNGPPAPCLDADTIGRFHAIIPKPEECVFTGRKNARAVFVLTAPRSGSTLLQTILAGHPTLFAPPELHLLWFRDLGRRRLALQCDGNRHLISGAIRAIMELDGLTVDQATDFLGQCEEQNMSVSEFYALLQRRLGSRLLVDKTPANAYSLEVLTRAELDFDNPLYLHLVRHPCGMARSFIEAKLERTAPFMLRHESEFTRPQFAELAWLTCNRNISTFLEGIPAERQHRICFEDLVGSPTMALQTICDFLGLDFYPEMLDPYQDKRRRMADGLTITSQMSGDLKFHLHTRIESEVAQRWQRFMSEDEMSDQTWSLAESLGYSKGA